MSVAVADFNGDGKQDLAVVHSGSESVDVLLGVGDGSFGAHTDYGVGNNPAWVAVGDFNADGKLDLAVANFDSASVSVLSGNGDGTFQAAPSVEVGQVPSAVVVADFNEDGNPDVATANCDESLQRQCRHLIEYREIESLNGGKWNLPGPEPASNLPRRTNRGRRNRFRTRPQPPDDSAGSH